MAVNYLTGKKLALIDGLRELYIEENNLSPNTKHKLKLTIVDKYETDVGEYFFSLDDTIALKTFLEDQIRRLTNAL